MIIHFNQDLLIMLDKKNQIETTQKQLCVTVGTFKPEHNRVNKMVYSTINMQRLDNFSIVTFCKLHVTRTVFPSPSPFWFVNAMLTLVK